MSSKTISCALGAAGFAASAALLAANVAPAQAGGLPEDEGSLKDTGYYEPAPLWTGFYLGVHAGYGWGEHEGEGIYTESDGDEISVLDPETGTIDLDGWFGGAQAGYNLQSDSLVFGVEGDISGGDIGGENTFDSDADDDGTADYTWNISTDLDFLATLRGRVGFLVTPEFLLYGTGGIAWGRTNSDTTVTGFEEQGFDPPEVTVLASTEEDHVGWVAGLGGEWMMDDNWSLKAEWQHVQFDDVDTEFSGTAYPGTPDERDYDQDSFPGDITIDTIRVGLNYKLSGPRKPLGSLK